MKAVLVSIGGCIALAACGSSGGSASYSGYVDQYFAVSDRAAPLDLLDPSVSAGVTDPATLPISGQARYDGVAYLQFTSANEGQTDLLGDMTLRANFSDSTVSGAMTDFVNLEEERYAGSLSIAEADIARDIDVVNDFTFVADLNGTITAPSGTQFESDAFIAGEFVGTQPDFIRGYVRGDLIEGALGTRVDLTETVFVGERQ